MTEFVPAQTSVPDWLMSYCRQLADVHYQRRLARMYVAMMEGFLTIAPWKANPPLPWYVPRTHRVSEASAKRNADLGWAPMNMQLPVDLVDRIKTELEILNGSGIYERQLSMRSFLYTAVVWWCTHVYEYKGPGLLES